MSKEENIKKDLEEIWYTLLNAKTAYQYAKYLFEPPTIKEQNYMKHYGTEMAFFRNILWRNSVIEISNLFAKGQDRSITKFLNNIDGGAKYSKEVPIELVKELRSKLSTFENIIEKILLMRNKVFAHAEKDYKSSLDYNKLDTDIEQLIKFSEDFISEISFVFNTTPIHEEISLEGNFDILNVLADYEEKRYNDIIENYKKFNN
jgi:hypothetical protein